MNTPDPELVAQFVRSSGALKRMISRISAVSAEEKLATSLQYQALSFLRSHDRITVGELAQELTMSSSAIAQFTERLVNAGWISRNDDKNDRRVVHLTLTEEGQTELKNMKRKYVEKMTRFLSLIPERDVRELVRIQTDLVRNLEEKKGTL